MMNKSLSTGFVLFALVAAMLVSASCGGTSSREDWLVVAGDDTLFVDDARIVWEGMSLEARTMFLEGSNPSEALVTAMARKALIESEIREQGILSEPDLAAFRHLWVGIESGIVSRRLHIAIEREALSEDDILFFTRHFGDMVWYTANPGTEDEISNGPSQLVLLEYFAVARQLEASEPGDVFPGPDRVRYRLDSLAAPDSLTLAEMLPDSAALVEEASVFISQQRTRDWYLALQDSLPSAFGIAVDTSLVISLAGYYSGTDAVDFSAVVIASELGDWAVIDLMRAVSFIDTRMPGDPRLESWLTFVISNVIMHDYFRYSLAIEDPVRFDSLLAEADRYVMELAVDTLFKREVENRIQITTADIEAEFNSQTSPVVTEEMRIYSTAVVSAAQLTALENLEDISSFLSGLPGYSEISVPGSDIGLTRPLRAADIPGGYGAVLFQQDSGDTLSWTGPFDIPGSEDKLFWRLVEVIPSRCASMAEITPLLEESVRNRLLQERVEQWVTELENRHGMMINNALIERLPENPGSWSSESL